MSEVLLIMIVVAISCSLIGNILVISNQSMVADALSHSVLLGIVLGFFLTQDLNSPLLLIGASVFGVLTIVVIEAIHSQKIAQDAATGLVFTFFFSLGVLLISIFARNVHLDLDIVLMGEVLFAPFVRSQFLGVNLPFALLRGIILCLSLMLFYALFFRRLSLYLFDKTQAKLVGVKIRLLKISLMFLVSLTIVAAFDSLGSITVISFLVAPAMISSLWTQTFLNFTALSLISSILLASLGYYLGMFFDVTLSGMTAVVALGSFLIMILIKQVVYYRAPL